MVTLKQVDMHFEAFTPLPTLHNGWGAERSRLPLARRRRPVGRYGLEELSIACTVIKIIVWSLKWNKNSNSRPQDAPIAYMHKK